MEKEFDRYKNQIVSAFADCDDFAIRECGSVGARFAMLFIKEITSRDFISERLLKPLLKLDMSRFDGNLASILEGSSISTPKCESDAARALLNGNVLILSEGQNGFSFILANAQKTPKRSIEEPSSDITIKGPKAGFVEDAETNMALLRKYIKTPALKFINYTIGSVSQTKVILAFVEGRAERKRVEQIKRRIQQIDARVITDSANIAMLLDGKSKAPLPTCGSTEKVDKTASKLMSGRMAIIVDGSPFVLTLPYLFIEGLQSADDYYHTPIYASFIRLLRLVAFVSAIFAPAILSVAVRYNESSLAPEFFSVITESRGDMPLSFFWEVMVILLLFEVLREVGVRMPRTVGDAVGIVGSIILGNTAVEAGIVSSVGVITVAFSAVCAFITPSFMYFIVFARIAVLIASELLGIWGIFISFAVLFCMIAFKKSFGVHYLYPLIPFDAKGMQDFIFSNPKKTLGRKEKL